MVHYSPIRNWEDDNAKKRVIDNLIRLRGRLRKDITQKRSDGTFLLASWNLRDFDSNKFGHGFRLDESFYYMAEIISAFDLIALQEVNRNLKGLRRLMRILGPDWDYIATDTTEGTGGNQERMAFVYNNKKIKFASIAGEIVLPGKKMQFARTPFIASFQAGWFRFFLCSVHIFFGETRGPKYEKRVAEISNIAEFLKKRQERETGDFIILGDFNIVNAKDKTMKALTKHGFTMPEELMGAKTNLKNDKEYDQIAMRIKNKMLEVDNSGVFDFDDIVFSNTDKDFNAYRSFMPERQIDGKTEAQIRKYYASTWRTFQLSDHKPLWVEMKVDFTNDYLRSLKPTNEPLADLEETD